MERKKRTIWKNGKWQFRKKKDDILNHNSGIDKKLPQDNISTTDMKDHDRLYTTTDNG